MVRISESNSNGCLRNVRTCLITNYSVPFNFYFITSFVWIVTKSPFFYSAKCWACLCLLTCSHSLSPCHVSLPGADVKVWAVTVQCLQCSSVSCHSSHSGQGHGKTGQGRSESGQGRKQQSSPASQPVGPHSQSVGPAPQMSYMYSECPLPRNSCYGFIVYQCQSTDSQHYSPW